MILELFLPSFFSIQNRYNIDGTLDSLFLSLSLCGACLLSPLICKILKRSAVLTPTEGRDQRTECNTIPVLSSGAEKRNSVIYTSLAQMEGTDIIQEYPVFVVYDGVEDDKIVFEVMQKWVQILMLMMCSS
jgi:hypothetical protein